MQDGLLFAGIIILDRKTCRKRRCQTHLRWRGKKDGGSKKEAETKILKPNVEALTAAEPRGNTLAYVLPRLKK